MLVPQRPLSMSVLLDAAVSTGTHIGIIVQRNDWAIGDALFQDAVASRQDAVDFMTFLCATRVSERRPLTMPHCCSGTST